MTPRNITERDMRQADLPTIAALEKVCFAAPWSIEALQDELGHPFAHYFVLETNEQILAYGGFWLILDEAHVTNIAVAPEFRRQGCGEKILLILLEKARLGGAHSMTLEVRENNYPARTLYEKWGFSVEGNRPRYYPDGQDALIMWKHDL